MLPHLLTLLLTKSVTDDYFMSRKAKDFETKGL